MAEGEDLKRESEEEAVTPRENVRSAQNQSGNGTPTDDAMSEYEEAELVWDEYKYRHEHIWGTLYKLTFTVAFLSAVPYLRPDIAIHLYPVSLLPMCLAIVLSFTGAIMIHRELVVFKPVKYRHREIHRTRREGSKAGEVSIFRWMVMLYLVVLVLVTGAFGTYTYNKIGEREWLPLDNDDAVADSFVNQDWTQIVRTPADTPGNP
ncbi:MAG: hypothetical protein QNI86_12665 [Halieaceae bacterium]|nr:hypothetical protein [Halieaceae bacterium]